MAVELMVGYMGKSNFMDEKAVQEAATAGKLSVEQFLRLLSMNQQQENQEGSSSADIDIVAAEDAVVNKLRKFISLLDKPRIGHARFRRGPVPLPLPLPETQKQTTQVTERVSGFKVYCPTPVHRLPPLPHNSQISHHHHGSSFLRPKNGHFEKKEAATSTITFSPSPPISAVSLTGDSESTQSLQPSLSSEFQFTHASHASSAGKPPLSSSSLKRKCNSMDDGAHKCPGSSGRCHCSKKRKYRVKRVIRVPAISSKVADIPPDEFSWRKYGQKPIKGSPHPRGYYRCSSMKGCTARKHVERAPDDPTMLIVTYENHHNHSPSTGEASPPLILESS